MLPFLKNKMEGSVAVEPDSIQREPDEPGDLDALEVAVKELFSSKSDADRAAAFRAAFQILESEPHSEAE